MSFRDFVSGSDCAVPNAVGRLANQVSQQAPGAFQDAHGFEQRDRSGGEEYVGLGGQTKPHHEETLFEHPAQQHHHPQHFAPPPPPDAFVEEFMHHQRHGPPPQAWHAEFEHFQNLQQQHHHHADMMAREFHMEQAFREQQQQRLLPIHEEWSQEFAQTGAQQQDWVNEFAPEATQAVPQSLGGGGINQEALQRLLNSDNPKFRNSKFVKFLSQLNDGELELDADNNTVIQKAPVAASAIDGSDGKWADEFDTSRAEMGNLSRDWAEEFHQESSADWVNQYEQQYGQEWADEFDNIDWKEYVESLQNAKFGDNPSHDLNHMRKYKFSEENPYMEADDPFTLGLQLMRDGNLSEAVLAFEAVAQKSPDNADGWRYLGQCNQENEDETQAIAALTQAVELDAYNLEALLMLGVSYTNDLEQTAALSHLKAWIENHPDYQFISFQSESHDAFPTIDSVLDLFQRAAHENPDDVEIQTALGVLFNISNDYDAAISCFRRCVELKPDDASLWNKLGATQANGSRSEEAVDAYRRALELKPNYVRALANLGISFANQGLHEQAAQAYLATLARNPTADHVWNYLKISLSTMDRQELIELANFKDVNVFREFFSF
eukprot:TRINITY_DN2068_c0_g1_i1.p1 TRINITY_DN2068_c0_g1~~TRINITY_DN2068_c0_g1_i1.p1  ORF type:complete len:608 (-),score=176.78 TRINITY_DN2068_c0_g1_i1:674-2497(-)